MNYVNFGEDPVDGHKFWPGCNILTSDFVRNFISLPCDDDGNRIRSKVSVAITLKMIGIAW